MINKKKIGLNLLFFFCFGGLLLPNLTKAFYEISDGSVKALYHFNGDSLDSSGNNNNGANTNISYTTGKLGTSSAQFVATSSSYINLPTNNFPLAGSPFTVSSWFKMSSLLATSTDRVLFVYGGSTSGNALTYQLERTPAGVNNLLYSNWDIIYFRKSWTPDITTWHNLVVTYATGTANMYFDGSLASTTAVTSNIVSSTMHFIGKSIYGEYFDGLIDELFLLNTAISSSTVSALYNGGLGNEICITSGCASATTTPTSTPENMIFTQDLSQISYIATTTIISGSVSVTQATYSLPMFLYIFILSLLAFICLVIFIFLKIIKK